MAQFGGMELTNAGRNILAKALLGKTLKFTRAWAGDGYITDDVLKHFREREDRLQHQINCLAQASIINSLEHIGQKHWQG